MPDNNVTGGPGNYRYRAGRKRLYLIWWVVGVAVQVGVSLALARKHVHWRAMLWSSLIFVVFMFMVESLALYWGWWVWNEQTLWGIQVGVIPLEELLLYFLVVPSLVGIQSIVQAILAAQAGKEK